MTGPPVVAPLFSATCEGGGRRVVVSAGGGDAAAVEDARDRFCELLGRFDPARGDSELAAVNAAVGVPVDCSWELLLLASVLVESGAAPGVTLDPLGPTVAATRALLPGRLGAALALDMVVHDLEEAGVSGCCVQWGDDARAVGTPAYATGWLVGPPDDPVRLVTGAVVRVGRLTVVADSARQACLELDAHSGASGVRRIGGVTRDRHAAAGLPAG